MKHLSAARRVCGETKAQSRLLWPLIPSIITSVNVVNKHPTLFHESGGDDRKRDYERQVECSATQERIQGVYVAVALNLGHGRLGTLDRI